VVGDLDLNSYCRSQNGTARLLTDNTWSCASSNGAVQRIDPNAACRQQYQRNDVAAQPRNDASYPTYRCVTT